MYSQSKGRHFNVGQHEDLLVYLLSVCPLHPGEDWEEDKKLNLILSKVQEHQQSLREPGSSGGKTKPTIFHAFLLETSNITLSGSCHITKPFNFYIEHNETNLHFLFKKKLTKSKQSADKK